MTVKLKFSNWKQWCERYSFTCLQCPVPGVYAIAESKDDLSNRTFCFTKDIIYLGMTNSQGGIKSRLTQFNNSLLDKPKSPGHGGADRIKHKRGRYDSIVTSLYVSILPVECDVKSGKAADLRTMGSIACLEYECFAQYLEKFGRLPEFNDHKQSPKKYTRHGYAKDIK